VNSTIVAALIFAGATLVLAAVLYLMYRQRQKVREQVARERAEREAKERQRKALADQLSKGNHLFNMLEDAARRNPAPNIMSDGRRHKTIGRIKIEKLPENGSLGYSIIASMPDPTCFTLGGLSERGYPLFQVNINVEKTGKEISVFKAPYGPGRDYKLENYLYVRDNLSNYVLNYQLFSDRNDETVFNGKAAFVKE